VSFWPKAEAALARRYHPLRDPQALEAMIEIEDGKRFWKARMAHDLRGAMSEMAAKLVSAVPPSEREAARAVRNGRKLLRDKMFRLSCRHISLGEKNDRPTESRSAPPPGRFLQLRMRLQIKAWSKSRPMLLTEEDHAAACNAYASLPDDSEPDEAIHWALSHEKLFLLHQAGPDELGVAPALTADDILRPCHGRAPSKLAVLYLQQALSKGGKFFDMVLRMYRKAMIRGSDAARDDGFGIASDEEMAEIMGR
jgi:hypothetical protein